MLNYCLNFIRRDVNSTYKTGQTEGQTTPILKNSTQ